MASIKVKTKFCMACGETLVKSEFSSWENNGKIYHYSYCKKCHAKKQRDYQKLQTVDPIGTLEKYLEQFGISLLSIVKKVNKERGLI
jgi:hypothetical protein